MKNKLPPVTATYFITLIKDYLKGTRTKQEILTETSWLLQPQAGSSELTHILVSAARDINEQFHDEVVSQLSYAADTAPTRPGLIHQLEACINGHISPEVLQDWATWHLTAESEDVQFADAAVEYFCFHWLPAQQAVSAKQLRRAVEILRLNTGNVLKDRIALTLLTEKERQHFLFFLRDYIDHHKAPDELDLYLVQKLGMDHQSFPYMQELQAVAMGREQLETLLEKACLVAGN
ncbi:hypothetical protein F0L74_14455 [Chitinophaga agrisoli]|uniref:Uncharacterized protein n=1 Tax=Chitinophaga agrisoli TaxID=2607653 RepID=A0A5B2VZV1_9BACT|nr:hypothetical protein [Chitinophaga agrisoli]KAA2243677.1 hypothetical protein F0L74_14455 [Chitinophaga agrisoli]